MRSSSGSGRFLVASMTGREAEETEGKRVDQCMLAEDEGRAAAPGQQQSKRVSAQGHSRQDRVAGPGQRNVYHEQREQHWAVTDRDGTGGLAHLYQLCQATFN